MHIAHIEVHMNRFAPTELMVVLPLKKRQYFTLKNEIVSVKLMCLFDPIIFKGANDFMSLVPLDCLHVVPFGANRCYFLWYMLCATYMD